MPYELKVDGLTEISEALSRLEERAPAIASQALYKGAGIMREEIQKGINTIKTAPVKYAAHGETRMPSPEEKAIVEKAAVGIAKFDKSGTEVNTSVGFANAGYAELAGKTVPVPKIVNAINSGTSFMPKQPFVRKAARTGQNKSIEAMKTVIETEFEAITKKTGG